MPAACASAVVPLLSDAWEDGGEAMRGAVSAKLSFRVQAAVEVAVRPGWSCSPCRDGSNRLALT